MVTVRRTALAALLATVSLSVAGCAGGSFPLSSSSASSGPSAAAASLHVAESVIRNWANALRRGDVNAAASYFSLPSLFLDSAGPPELIRTRAEAEAINQALPCGARLLSASWQGTYVSALFQLTGRPGPGGGSCASGAGQTARADFQIRDRHISLWLRAPTGGTPTTPGGQPLGPSQVV